MLPLSPLTGHKHMPHTPNDGCGCTWLYTAVSLTRTTRVHSLPSHFSSTHTVVGLLPLSNINTPYLPYGDDLRSDLEAGLDLGPLGQSQGHDHGQGQIQRPL